MAATLGNGNITFGDGSSMSSATLAWSQVSSKPFNDLAGYGNWNCTNNRASSAPANTGGPYISAWIGGGNANCTNCYYSGGIVSYRSGDTMVIHGQENYVGYNNCNCDCDCDCG